METIKFIQSLGLCITVETNLQSPKVVRHQYIKDFGTMGIKSMVFINLETFAGKESSIWLDFIERIIPEDKKYRNILESALMRLIGMDIINDR